MLKLILPIKTQQQAKPYEVHTALQALKTLVKDYYNSEIVPTLFEYEFLK